MKQAINGHGSNKTIYIIGAGISGLIAAYEPNKPVTLLWY